MRLLKYRWSDGGIDAVVSTTDADVLRAQRVAADPTYGYVVTDSTEAVRTLQERYRVADTTLVAKTALVLSGTPTPFAADGIEACVITVTPFVACTLLVNGTPTALTDDDPTLTLTSDVPLVFTLSLAAHPTAWASPITVEAT